MTWVAGCLFVALYDHWRSPPRVCTIPVSALAEQVPITGFRVGPPAGGVPVEVQTIPHGVAELDRVIVYKRLVQNTTGVQNPAPRQDCQRLQPYIARSRSESWGRLVIQVSTPGHRLDSRPEFCSVVTIYGAASMTGGAGEYPVR